MALTLRDLHLGGIVDWVSEWGEDGKERPRDTILRGIIVKMTGSQVEQSVTDLHVCFGDKHGKPIEVNGVKIKAVNVKAAELAPVFDHESKESKIAWRRLFGQSVNVGAEFAQRKNRSQRRIIKDELGLTPKPKDAVVTDSNDEGVDEMELPDTKA